jgi:hypothetical protein
MRSICIIQPLSSSVKVRYHGAATQLLAGVRDAWPRMVWEEGAPKPGRVARGLSEEKAAGIGEWLGARFAPGPDAVVLFDHLRRDPEVGLGELVSDLLPEGATLWVGEVGVHVVEVG